MTVEVNFLGALIEYENKDQEDQEYSIMWKMGEDYFETPILAIKPVAQQELVNFQNTPYYVVSINAKFESNINCYQNYDGSWQPKFCDFVLKHYSRFKDQMSPQIIKK